MRISLLSTALFAAVTVVAAQAGPVAPGTPLLRYDFESISPTPGIDIDNNGSLGNGASNEYGLDLIDRSPSTASLATGVTGFGGSPATTGDALLTNGTFGGTNSHARSQSNAIGPVGGLESFTLAGWIWSPANVTNWNGGQIFINHSGGDGVFLRGTGNDLVLLIDQEDNINTSPYNTTATGGYVNGAGGNARWAFFAVTWDGSDPNQPATFYAGREDGISGAEPSLLTTTTLPDTTTDLGKVNATSTWMSMLADAGGNNGFGGRLDALTLWGATSGSGGALSADEVEGFWLESQGLPIPEPASLGLLMVGGALLGLRNRRRA